MKKIIIPLIIMASLVILFSACPYASSVPIDNPSVKVDKNLLGKWVKASDQSAENPTFYEINQLDVYKYNIVKNEYNTYDSAYTKTAYVGHISKIDNISFLNMQQDGKGDYYIHRINLGDGEFTFIEVTDNIDEKFNSSEELKAFIKKHMNLSFFYNKDEERYTKSN
jgi:uncharacterized protein YxeA